MAGYIGQQFGKYRLLQLLGHGSSADVYVSEHIYTGTQAAIKVLHANPGNKEVEQFRQEAGTVARLVHPHIVRVLDFGVEEAIPYLALSYAPNGTIRDRHPRGAILPLSTVVEYIRQLADALQYAHSQRIIHGAIKPANILVGKSNELLLSDFGIALILQHFHSGNTRDAAAYMAPEQIKGYPCPASDQYALGILAYEWLCGFSPFQGTSSEMALQRAVTPPALRERLPGIPPAVESVILTALAQDPARRFASIQSFARAFEQASQPISSVLSQGAPFTGAAGSELPTAIVTPSPVTITSSPPTAAQPPASLPVVDMPPVGLSIASTPADWPVLTRDPRLASDGQPVNPVPPPSSDIPPRLRRSLNWKYVFLILLALLAIGGGILGSLLYFSNVKRNTVQRKQAIPTFQTLQTAIVSKQSEHKKQVNAYNNFITADGGMFGFNAQHTRFNPYEVILDPAHIRIVKAWTASTGAGIEQSSAVVAGGVVYIGSHDGKLYAFDAISGQQKWVALTQGPLVSSPAVANGLVYIGSEDHRLYAFDIRTGQQKWVFLTKGPIDSSPTLAYGMVYLGSRDANVYAIDGESGKQQWAAGTDGSGIYSSPAVLDGQIYIASLNGTVYAFNRNSGKQLWATPTRDPIYSSPAVANGLVYLGSYNHKLYALDAQTGRQRWVKTTSGAIFASPAVAYRSVYISTLSGSLYAFNSLTGALRWVKSFPNPSKSSPFVADRLIYLGTTTNAVLAFNVFTGKKQGLLPTKAPITDSPTIANGVVYIGAADGKVYAFHAA